MPPDPGPPERLHCDGVILDYLEGELAADQATELETHVAGCGDCARLLAWTRDQRSLVLAANLRHLSSDAVAAMAEGRVPTPGEAAHLGLCGDCSRDLEWARETLRGRVSRQRPEGELFVPEGRGRWPWWLLLLAMLLAVAVAVLLLLPAMRGRMAYVVTSGRTISVQAPPFGTLWSEAHDATVEVFGEAPWTGRRTLLYGLKGDGPEGGVVHARDFLTGESIWKRAADSGATRRIFGKEMGVPGSMTVSRFHTADLDGDGSPEVVALRLHSMWFPSSLTAYREDGTILGAYYNWGVIYDVQSFDLDADGKDEVIAAGTNNGKAYQGATIFLLDERHFSGASVDSLVGADSPVPDSSLVRVVLPRFEQRFMDLLEIERLRIASFIVTGAGDSTRIQAIVDANAAPVVVTFDRELRPLSHAISDSMRGILRSWPPEDRQRFLGEYQDEWFATIVRFERAGDRSGG